MNPLRGAARARGPRPRPAARRPARGKPSRACNRRGGSSPGPADRRADGPVPRAGPRRSAGRRTRAACRRPVRCIPSRASMSASSSPLTEPSSQISINGTNRRKCSPRASASRIGSGKSWSGLLLRAQAIASWPRLILRSPNGIDAKSPERDAQGAVEQGLVAGADRLGCEHQRRQADDRPFHGGNRLPAALASRVSSCSYRRRRSSMSSG